MSRKRPQFKRDAVRMNERRQAVARLYLRGQTQHEIAAQVGVDQGTVSRDLAAIQKQWKSSAVAAIDELKAQQLAKVDALERTYWEAWERSCKPRETNIAKMVDGKGERKEATTHKEGRDGNPKFLEGVLKCIERRCQLLGIDAPKRLEHSGPGGGPIQCDYDLSGLTDDQLAQLEALALAAAPGSNRVGEVQP